jgi:hypothetical protein
LRQLVDNAGTVGEIAKRMRVPKSTLHAVLAGGRLPTSHFVMLLVQECKGARLIDRPMAAHIRMQIDVKRALILLKEARAEWAASHPPRPRRPPVKIPQLPEERELADAIREEFARTAVQSDDWRQKWPYGLTPGWVGRYCDGRTVPSTEAASSLVTLLVSFGGHPSHDLVNLAAKAKRARVTARRRAREGRPWK